MLTQAAFATIAKFLKSHSGLIIGPDKLYLLETRLAGILKQHGLADLHALAERLPLYRLDALGQQVVEAMTTNESFFFRDEKPFTHARLQALPALHAARPSAQPLRIWSAAASSGQEAYSLAMIASELRPMLGSRKIELLGTDIARDQLARARGGLYSQFEVQRGLPVGMLMKYMAKEAAGWRVHEALRAMVEFREWNLLSDLRGLGRFDIVFCRNVLIYFDQPTKRKVLDAIAAIIADDGFLYLGGAETALGITDCFAPLPGENGVLVPARALRRAPAGRFEKA